LTDRDTRNTGN